MKSGSILTLDRLSAGYGTGDVISEISFSLRRGEILCIAGQSGCGKSTLLRAITGVFDLPEITGGSVTLDGTVLTGLPKKQRRELSTRSMGLIFQNPGAAFNPIRSYEKQFREALSGCGKYDKSTFHADAEEVFSRLGLDDAERLLGSCPYEMSGGMNQRIAIALTMLMGQRLLLADEPTSALDAGIRRQVADEIKLLRDENGVSVIAVTHDLALARYIADRVAIMLGGRIVELGGSEDVITAPEHPYTRALIGAAARLGGSLPEFNGAGFSLEGTLRESAPGHFVLTEDSV